MELIVNNTTEGEILKESINSGMRYMREDGIEKVKLGLTSIEELLRVMSEEGEECPKKVRKRVFYAGIALSP
jgi:hypothetical protein